MKKKNNLVRNIAIVALLVLGVGLMMSSQMKYEIIGWNSVYAEWTQEGSETIRIEVTQETPMAVSRVWLAGDAETVKIPFGRSQIDLNGIPVTLLQNYELTTVSIVANTGYCGNIFRSASVSPDGQYLDVTVRAEGQSCYDHKNSDGITFSGYAIMERVYPEPVVEPPVTPPEVTPPETPTEPIQDETQTDTVTEEPSNNKIISIILGGSFVILALGYVMLRLKRGLK